MAIRLINYVNNQLSTPALYTNSFANRPTFGIYGRLFMSTDTKEIYQDLSTSWSLIADAGSGSGSLQSVCTNGSTTTTGITILSNNLALTNAASSFYIKALTVGSVLFCDDVSGLVSQDNTNFFWDNTNNRLGLGTAAPSARLDVHSSSGTSAILNGTAASNALLTFQNTGVSKWSVGNFVSSTVADDFNIYDTVNTVSRLQVHNTGVVNIPTSLIIGTTTPTSSYALDVTGSGRYTSTLLVTGIATFSNNVLLSATNRLYLSSTSYIQEITAGTIRLAPAGNDSFDITNSLLNVWVASIFDSTLSAKATTINANDSALVIQATTVNKGFVIEYKNSVATRRGYIGYGADSSTLFEVSNNENGAIDFRTNAAFAMRITSGGNVLIGSTTDNGYKLQVNAEMYATGYIVANSGGSIGSINSGAYISLLGNTQSILFGTNNAEKMSLNTGGVLKINNLATGAITSVAGVITSSSDKNLKIDDGTINSALDKVLKLQPRYFYWKEETELDTKTRQLGFYAQEVNEALGEEAANTPTDNRGWGIYDRAIIAMLTKSIQELNEKLVRNNIN